ncbi:endospore germination permease [Paenibacillus barcinonensis]|uniref:GerAB/ArcD/ProY family transporter n=1 Tax=Paenibacillus TaxID=44249 RepID=UPI001C11526F|nr:MULTISPECIES: endospore germination permease [Paenibacillus]MBU5355962.1 endospore germination permease [Paenibacillus barcinonensis]MDM5279967.1 endospore germination permease [Paenibacillus silvae]
MLEKGRLGIRSLATLTFMMVVGDMMLIYPSVITSYAKQNAWICALIGIPISMLLMAMFLRLGKAYPDQNLVAMARSILGFWPGTLVAVFYLYFFLIGASTHAREVGDFLVTQIYPYTPIRVLLLLFLAAVCWSLYNGIETIGRVSELLLPIVVVFILILAFCLLPQVDTSNLKPFQDTDVVSLAQGILVSIIYPVGETIPILMLLPYTSREAHRNRDVIIAAGLGNLMLAMLVTISILVLGAFLTQHNIYASFILSQKINIADFFQRIEAFMASAWLISTYFKATIYLYAFTMGIAELFKLNHFRFLILPSSMLAFGLSNVMASSVTFIIITVVPYWVDWDTTIGILLPGLLLIVHGMRSKFNQSKQ